MFLWWGPEFTQIYNDGYRPSLGDGGRHPRALGMSGLKFWTDIWDIIRPDIDQVMAGGDATWHVDNLIPIERNGRKENVWWTYSYSPAFDDTGMVGGVLVICQETTTRVLAEAAMKESEARYRTLFESLDEGFCVIEMIFDEQSRPLDYVVLEANAAAAHQAGLPNTNAERASQLLPRLLPQLLPQLDQHWFEAYGHVALTGESIRFEARENAPANRWYEVYASRVGQPADRKVAVLFRNISAARAAATERERLARELEVERARLAYVFQQAPAFIAVLRGPQHILEFVNEAYERLIGRRLTAGRPLGDALPEVRDQGFLELLDDVLATGVPFIGQEASVFLSRVPGQPLEERFVDFVYLPIMEADGSRSGVIAHGTDVTEQVRARHEVERLYALEQEARVAVEEAYRVADSANRAKAEFLATMSHELRTPLNAIGGYTELMELGIHGPITLEQAVDLRRIQQSQRHLLGLINEVLNYAKLETGTVHYDLSDVLINDVLIAAESLVAPQASAKGLKLVVAACPDGLAVRADAEKVRQVLANLLSNAVKFTPTGGRIEMSCAEAGPNMMIRVSDTGMGIAADKMETIFDPFVQVNRSFAQPMEGTGLGLAISRDLARGMSGELTVESREDTGSTFILTLPHA
jgi:signal transduction histidine kinase